MEDPKTQLRDYLDTLIHRFLNTKSLRQELSTIHEWNRPGRRQALNLGAYFFQLASYSLSRMVLVELCRLLTERENRSLLDWLRKAKEHAGSIEPARYSPRGSGSEYELIDRSEYREIVDSHLEMLSSQSDVIGHIKARRDKSIAHFDKKYFGDQKAIYEDYPLGDEDLDQLMSDVSEILREHYLYLFKSNLLMEVTSARRVETILDYVRAFQRVRSDHDLLKKGFRPMEYRGDDFNEGDGA